jgi:carbonic anhydrase/acetyltransferase-like protein (isoleucine patch superfamily)
MSIEGKAEDFTESEESEDSEEEPVREEVRMQYILYMILFFIIYYISWILPSFILMFYFVIIFRTYFLDAPSFVAIFTQFNSLLALFLMPLVLILAYLVRMFFIGLSTRIIWITSEKISPSKSGIIPRNIKSKAADYYHIRSFVLKYGKNIFTKGALPWLSNWFYNFVKSAKIGKGTTIEESLVNDKFMTVGKNCYFGVNSSLSSHVVEGIFGNISYFEVKAGDNVTFSGFNSFGPGTEIHDNSFLLPLASAQKHAIIGKKGGKNFGYYFGLPARKIFKKKLNEYLGLSPEQLEINENMEEYLSQLKEKKLKTEEKKSKKVEEEALKESKEIVESNEETHKMEEPIDINTLTKEDLAIDFTTSSAISRVNLKFLAVYFPIFWLSGLLVAMFWYENTRWLNITTVLFLPVAFFAMIYIFIFAVLFFSKLFLIFLNLLHQPREGVFIAEIGDKDYEFWMMRTELKKIALWFFRNTPLPWLDVIAFRWFGIRMDFTSHLNDAWCDAEFVDFGRNCLVGQGATVMSSMVVGKYLIIKRVIFDDFVLVGGQSTIAPGTIIGHDGFIGALSTTTYNQVLEPEWIYFGIPAIKLKKNKYAATRRDVITRRSVDDETKVEEITDVHVDDDKRKLIKTGDSEE